MLNCPHPRDQLTPLLRARDYVTGDLFEVGRCQRCGLDVTAPQPAPETLAAYYPAEYYRRPGERRFPAPVEALQRLLYGRRARAVEAIAGGKPGRVLDIGCGPGSLLDAFRRRGWEVQGVELSEGSAVHAREVLHIPVHVGSPDSWPWPAGHFDAVVMWHVLEHWPDPRPVMRAAHRLLRPGGAFMAGVPNFGSLEARLARAGWFHLDVPRHLVHFTPDSLRGALVEAGFEPRRSTFFAPEYDYFSFVQSALNQLGLRQNLLYNLLRGRGSKVLRDGAGRLQTVATLLLAAPLGVLSLPATALLAAAGQGSSVTVYARKGDGRQP